MIRISSVRSLRHRELSCLRHHYRLSSQQQSTCNSSLSPTHPTSLQPLSPAPSSSSDPEVIPRTLSVEEKRELDTALAMARMLKAFRTRGHFAAKIDPLDDIMQSEFPNSDKEGEEGRQWLQDRTKPPDVVRLLRRGIIPLSLSLSLFLH